MAIYAVETTNLVKIYSGRKVIDNVSIHIPSGTVYGFVGENGSGKTTIIRLLMGLALPNEGSYSLYGVDFKDKEIFKIKKNVSAIVESPSIVTNMTAYQNLKYACLYFGIKDYNARIKELLKLVGLEDTGRKKAGNFSLGMRQRLGIALLLLNNPKLILLDEPMNGLDPSGVAELRDLILKLNEQGITFLISSHILSELEKVATHWGFISHGQLIKEISNEDLHNECEKSIEISYHDLHALEEAVKAINVTSYKLFPNCIRIFDEIKPLDLLTKLSKKGLEIEYIKTIDMNVEDYYLQLIGGKTNA